jgi:hypothetical protein
MSEFVDSEIESVKTKIDLGCSVQYVRGDGFAFEVYKTLSNGNEKHCIRTSGNALPYVVEFENSYDAAKTFVETICEMEGYQDEEEASDSSDDGRVA